MRKETILKRVRTASVQIVDSMKNHIDNVACDKMLGKKSFFKGSGLDASEMLRTFNSDNLKIYFDVLIKVLEKVPPPAPFVMHDLSHISEAAADVDALIEQLRDPKPRVRSTAARNLGTLGRSAEAAVPYLAEMLNDTNVLCRHRAQTALHDIIGNYEGQEADNELEDRS